MIEEIEVVDEFKFGVLFEVQFIEGSDWVWMVREGSEWCVAFFRCFSVIDF